MWFCLTEAFICVNCGAPHDGGTECRICGLFFDIGAPARRARWVPQSVLDRLHDGKRVEAIDLYKTLTGCSRRDAEAAIRAFEN